VGPWRSMRGERRSHELDRDPTVRLECQMPAHHKAPAHVPAAHANEDEMSV
jgi:hypothetical protein